jgi:uncharacterized membrane-anchored protein YjiN (DUF445 family)
MSNDSRGNLDDQRLHDLRRMRLVATLLLVLMAIVFIATSLAMNTRPWLAYLRAFAEAAMVGACADWFAVVALFRHPFGLPFAHTGIVPRNKERIGAALGRFMSTNFLSPGVLAKKLDQLDPAQWSANWLCDGANVHRLARQVSLMLPRILGSLPHDLLAAWLAKLTRRGIEALPAAPLVSRILAIAWEQAETHALLNRAIDLAEASLLGQKDFIQEKVTQHSSRLVPRWVDGMLADKIVNALRTTLAEMRMPDHPWRIGLHDAINGLILDLANDPAMQARTEKIKADLLTDPQMLAHIKNMCRSIEARINETLTDHAESVSAALEFALSAAGKWLQEEAPVRAHLNRWVRHVALRTLAPRRADIGAYIADVVANWDSTTLVKRLELQVGSDLQYIRINGTLVGGLVGLILFVVSKWIKPL